MESPQLHPASPTVASSNGGPLKSSSSSTKVVDDVTSLTSFNPFSEEDEHESSYTLVSSIFSRVKNSFAAPLSSAVAAASGTSTANARESVPSVEQKRPSVGMHPAQATSPVLKPVTNKLRPKIASAAGPTLAPPLVSVIPARPETPIFSSGYENPAGRSGLLYSQSAESQEGGLFGTVIPGFPIQDDARSIRGFVGKDYHEIIGWMTKLAKNATIAKVCSQPGDESIIVEYVARFFALGMLRVCNLCLEKLNYDDDGDDDDRRSVISNLSSSWPYPVADHYLQSLGHHSQSPFAASQLFGRTDEPYSLYSIAETKRHLSGSDGGGFGSRPLTPGGDAVDGYWEESEEAQPAPFRRTLTDEDKDPLPDSEPFASDQSPTAPRSATKTPDLQTSLPFQATGSKSSIQFPGGSPDLNPDGLHASRSRVDSYAETEIQTPFLRSRVHSRLNELALGEAGWRTRRESIAYAQELNTISMFHLRIMLRQMLTTEGISNIREWEETLLKLALRIARELTFTAYPYREGADMDVRRYVKIKKIPGGSPRDSEYVDGAVITKNVAHKQMPRSQRNPRIMLLTFPLEFQRVEGQYMHFGQIVRQEKEYLTNLVSRIAALRPHVVLAEKSVSRLALEELVKHRIAVARTVKESAIKLVARMTQADIFSSIDKLALEPRLGHCGNYRIQTFDHPLIPCRRKSYMRFEGCSRDLGCTIILRGGDVDHLRRVKKVTLFLAFIVRNLKLETHLWKDSVITAPHLTADAAPPAHLASVSTASAIRRITQSAHCDALHVHMDDPDNNAPYDELPNEEVKSLELSRRIQASLEPYLKTFISVSATLRFPPPYPIWRMKELDDELQRARRSWEDEIIRSEEKPSTLKHARDETITASSSETLTTAENIKAQIEALPSPGLPESPGPVEKSPSPSDSSTSTLSTDYFSRKLSSSSSYSNLRSPPVASSKAYQLLEKYEQVSLRDEGCIAAQSAYDRVKWQHDEQRRVWEWYLRKNNDDFVVDKYQYIIVIAFTLPITDLGNHRACFPPELKRMTFYGDNDCTLGQFIDKAIHDNLVQFLDPKAICSGKGCDQPLARHCRAFVHNESRLIVYVEHWDGQIKTRLNAVPSPDLITTWSACRVCGSATPFIPVSEEMQRYSFAKFLELHFYPADVQLVQGAGCVHNIYQHHIRYFAMRGMTVMFQTDPITLYELVYPPSRIHIRKETLFHLKNEDYETLLRKNALWYSALVDDLKLINQDAATGDEETDAALTANINRLVERAINERIEMAQLIQEVYKNTSPIDTLALNRVRAETQDKIVAWEADFDKLPKPKLSQLTDKDRRGTTFGTVRAMWPRRYDLPGVLENLHLPPSNVSESVSESEEMPASERESGSQTSVESTVDASDAEYPSRLSETLDPLTEISGTVEEASFKTSIEGGSDSDSTIAPITRGPEAGPSIIEVTDDIVNQPGSSNELGIRHAPPMSKLPRRSGQHPSVADLVKRYQDFLPAPVSTDLARSSFPTSALSGMESDQETPTLWRPPRPRIKSKPKILSRKESVSDFEHSYAANVAPKYLAPRRVTGAHQSSRIPGPAPVDSRDSSRRTSPDKRPSYSKQDSDSTVKGGRASSPPPRVALSGIPGRATKSVAAGRVPKDRSQPSRVGSMSNVRNAFRKASNTNFGGKVSNLARQFERINKDFERTTRRYAVIRGRRARPVASSKATVEVFDSVRDAIKDSDVSGESSSEADDEDDDEDDASMTMKTSGPASTRLDSRSNNNHDEEPPDQGAKGDEAPAAQADKIPTSFVPSSSPSTEVKPVGPVVEAMPSPLLQGQPNRTPSETPSPSDIESGTSGIDRPSTIMKALSGFLPNHLRGHFEFEADDPMADPEHIFRESSMVVRTDEPTSIIALALNSPQYREMLAKSKAEKRLVKEPRVSDGEEAFMPDDCSVTDTNSTWGVVNVDSGDDANPTEDLRVPSSKLPWAISFESGDLTITCTILYPEQFDALRRTYDCERSMIESLARCVKWNASGGKSGSAFLKTRDDRFIAKELSRSELETMATFGPAYFDYMSSAVTAGRPTLLARVFGCYKLVFRKKTANERSSRSKSTQMNLLVMENLFYDKRFSKIYDLKGSTRNRHVLATGRENEVLLDENLMQTAHLSPFYVREHAKRLFRGALFNDTKFLADINVMDYSLVAGVDSVKNELVVGIVDYIRTYTWDKKLESWVKESTFLAGAGKGEPTIITPKQYRQRFLSAMERYFPLVPDRWMKQIDNEDECNGLQDLWPDW
ncbi:MDM12_4 [Sanghuangporus weigelae]